MHHKARAASLLVALLVATGVTVGHAQQSRIYIANDDHTDYLWTADAETYNAVFVDMLDYYLRLADEAAPNAAPYQSRFNVDGSYWLWQYTDGKKRPGTFHETIPGISGNSNGELDCNRYDGGEARLATEWAS